MKAIPEISIALRIQEPPVTALDQSGNQGYFWNLNTEILIFRLSLQSKLLTRALLISILNSPNVDEPKKLHMEWR